MKEGRLYVRYCRVSTDKQGRSGLGLEAQKAALAAAKARGVKLGGDSVYRPATGPDQAQGTQAAAQARSLRAAQFRARVRPQMEALAEPGMSLRELARKLNQAGLEGPRGKPWNHQTVKAVMRCPTQTTA